VVSILGAGDRNNSIEKISEMSKEQLATVEDLNNRGDTTQTTAPSKSLNAALDQ